MNRYFHTLLVLVLSGVLILNSAAYAQSTEVEPNNPCANAQNVGAINLPFTQNGSIDSTPESYDVDFFKFTGTPGELLKVDIEGEPTGKGTLVDPLVGIFDSSCNPISGLSYPYTLGFSIPADGLFIIGATSCCDSGFVGEGNTPGTYQITISHFGALGSISGQVVHAEFGDPLPGDIEPFASLDLYRCEPECRWVNYQKTDSEGRFWFSSDYSGFPLLAGKYQIRAQANEYESSQTDLISVAEDENRIVNVLLQPFPIQFSDGQPCDNLTSKGGICRYSVKVTNQLNTPFYGKAWSIVWVSSINSFVSFTKFKVKTELLKLKSHKSTKVQFEFRVPAGALVDGTDICADVTIGQNPHAIFNTVKSIGLFCITKDNSGFKVMPEKKSQEMFRQLNGKTAQRAAAKAKVKAISR